ncbi:site-specific DNA-cytosine methylase [Azospirillum agricola]|uniref:DNA cytosine methyltransferase n=1 Tax=Azospirillum agricola TaxID=1720247 RepID=UPI001AEB8DA1|nr:DNA cytosine methyltransferase [Azospirillum agricola]MBP2232482.1 site-specific DNA-cytosine methylase [Azospirillum agricola]
MDDMPSLFETDMLPVSTAIKPNRARTRSRRRSGDQERRPDGQWPLDDAINVVLFAGLGGACQGLEDAGFPVHVAVNHDGIAIAAHKALNPHTRHLHADIYEVCPLRATKNRHVNILWLSPDCRDHSVAKGGAPRSKRVRSMPWQGCRWVGKLRKRGLGPAVVYLENVREIRGWARLIAKRDKATGRVLKLDGTVAAKGERVPVQEQQLVRDPKAIDRKTGIGRTYRAWVRHMEGLGVRYEDRDIRCADVGIPTSRIRLWGVGVFDDKPIVWPQLTHAPRNSELVRSGSRLPYRAAAEIIDWSLPLPSIFSRKKDLAAATQKRIAVGLKRFVLEAEKPFLVHLTHGCRDHDVDEPIPTITSAHRGEFAVVGPAVVPTTHTSSDTRIHDGATPLPTLTAGVKGGELAVMGASIIGAGGRAAQVPPMDVADPLNTSTTKEDRCVVAATLVGVAHGDDARSGSRTYDIKDALRTATGSNDQAVIAAHLTRYHGERRPGEARGTDPSDSLATLTTENRFGMVGAVLAPHVTKFRNNSIGHELTEPLHTVTCSHSAYHPGAAPPLGIVSATLAPAVMANNANNIGAAVEAPMPTATTGNRNFVVAAHVVEHRGESIGQQVQQPLGAQTQIPHHGVVAAHLTKFQENSVGQAPEEPIDTVMAGALRFGVVGAFLEEHRTRSVGQPADAPLATQTGKEHSAVIGAAMVQTGYGEREGQAPRALDVGEPVGTQVAGGAKHGVVGAWLVQHNTGVIGHTADDPLSTMTTAGTQQQVAAAYVTEFRGTSRDGQPVTEPAPTMCTGGERGGGHSGVTAAYLSEYYSVGGQHQTCDAPLNTLTTNDRFAVTGASLWPDLSPEKLERARQVANFLRAHGCWDDREFVTVGQWLVIDIGMRMLTPTEAAAAHELRMPDQITVPKRDRKGLVVTGEDGNVVHVTRPLTKTEAMRLVGNSVPKRMATLLAQANAHHALYAPSRAQVAA